MRCGGLDCRASWQAGEWGQHCRFCGFESDGVKYPPCPDSHKGASAELSADEAWRFLELHRMSRGKCLSCLDACKDMVCPKVCGGLTDEGDDMTCEADAYCMDDSIDPYGGMGCNVRARPLSPETDTGLTLIRAPTRRATRGSTAASAASSRMGSSTRPAPKARRPRRPPPPPRPRACSRAPPPRPPPRSAACPRGPCSRWRASMVMVTASRAIASVASAARARRLPTRVIPPVPACRCSWASSFWRRSSPQGSRWEPAAAAPPRGCWPRRQRARGRRLR